MDPLTLELERCIDAILDALSAGDAAALAELFIDPTTEDLARRAMPPRVRRPLAVRALGARWAGYAYVRVTGGVMSVSLVRFFRRGDRWLAADTELSSPLAAGTRRAKERALASLFELAESMASARGGTRRDWPPAPAAPTPLDRVRVVALAPRGIPDEVIDEAERALGCAFPSDYREYVGRFGEVQDSLFVRVYPPSRVLADNEAWRRRVDAYWFWSPSLDGFDAVAAQRSFCIADTVDGDELVLDPSRPDALYLLPRHDEEAVRLDGGLTGALAWMCETDALTAPTPLRWVEPLEGAVRLHFATDDDESGDRTRDALRALEPATAELAFEDGAPFRGLVFLPSIGGTASVGERGGVTLVHDPIAPDAALARVRAALEACGLTPDG